MRTARVRSGAVAVAAAGLSLMGAGSSRADVGATAPPLPPQPSNSTPAPLSHNCPATDDRAGRWTPITEQISGPRDRAPAFSVTVDPWAPCLMYRADDAQTVDRSADGGRTWTPVFHDALTGTYSTLPGSGVQNTPPFTASAMVIPHRGAVVLGERGNGDAVAASGDAGHTWTLANSGLSGQPVEGIVAAPNDPGVAYALRSNNVTTAGFSTGGTTTVPVSLGVFTVFVTRDGGASWSAAATLTVPSDPQSAVPGPDAASAASGTMPLLAIDPRDASQVWALVTVQSSGLVGIGVVFESADYGAHWKQVGRIGPGVFGVNNPLQITQFVVTRSARHALRLFAVGSFPSGGAVEYSDDDGATWFTTPLQTYFAPAIAVDPVDQDHILYAATAFVQFNGISYPLPQLEYSTDGFSTVRRIQPPRPSGLALVPGPITPSSGAVPPNASLQADRQGHFYLGVSYQCSGFALPPGCPAQGANGEVYYRLTPPVPVPAAVSFAPPPGSALPVGPATPSSTPGSAPIPLLELKSCPTPVPGATSGTLSFDYTDLLYTQYEETGPEPLTAVIHRMSPVTCADTGVLVVHFSIDDLRAIAARNDYSSGDRPSIETLTYDARRNAVWFMFSDGNGYLFMAPLGNTIDAGAGRVDVTATLRFNVGQGCMPLLSYDVSDDSLWTCYGNTPHVRASDGAAIYDDCGVNNVIPPVSAGLPGLATWVVSAPGHILLQGEDDHTLYDYNHITCTLEHTYEHRVYAEPTGEDEQEACDPLTYGASSPLPIHATALWIRDASASTVTAYALPDGACPLPTVTRYVGQTRAEAGGQVVLCGTLTVQGRNHALAGLPLQFLLDGATVDTMRITDANGLACTNPVAAPSPGTHDILVDFTGDVSYLPSHDLAALLVTAPGALTPPRPLTPPAAPPPPPPAPQTAPLPQPAPLGQVQIQAQAQVQTQAQAQSQAQPAGQSVVVTQRQQQAELQMAFAEQRTAVQQAQAPQGASYEMTRLGSSDEPASPDLGGVALGVLGLIGTTGLGIAWALRAPEYAFSTAARRRASRRRGRGSTRRSVR